ncbi:MAG: replicative DNA helicase [Gammaproteobacteria bacterium]|nr:replicative DNA helicase [Gammaproteobacteria bacterium]MXY64346.1 replicative DNA helicase [Gammaproteobacteria bacterium]MYG66082.1 replicative DNA helicase [Gammaproteobacteria bacterium]
MKAAELVSGTPKLPPQALEAEQSLLGGLLLDNRRWDEVSDEVGRVDFYNQSHRLIFDAVRALQGKNEPADVITVSEWLEQNGNLEEAGGLAYVGNLASNTPSTANILNYARIVRERSILRSLISAANEISDTAYTPEGKTPREVLDHAEKLVFDISEHDGRRRQGFTAIQELLTRSVDHIEELYESKETVTGMPTGFTDLDEMTAGLQRGDLVVVAGRPSMGKTAFAMNVAEFVALEKNRPVAVFSMEMPGEQLAMRLLSSIGRINSNKVRTGRLGDDDWPRLTSAVGLLDKAPIFVDDTAGLNPLDLSSRARRLSREHNDLGLVVVDYLQLMQSMENNENRATEISNITRALKMLAKELNVPVMVLSQLNRSLEQRPNKRPIMSDLRESGAIEQDADVIFFVYRDEVYNEESEQKGRAEIIIGKQRNGPIGMVPLTFLGEFTRFENFVSQDAAHSFGA